MEKLCSRVRAEDTAALEALVKPVRDRASAAAQDFLLLHSSPVSQKPSPPAAQSSSCVSRSCHSDELVDEELVSGRQIQLHFLEIPADQSVAESWDNLEEVCMSNHFPHFWSFKQYVYILSGYHNFIICGLMLYCFYRKICKF